MLRTVTRGLVGQAQLGQRLLHGLGLLGGVGVGYVDHVQQEIGLGQLLQRGPEGGDQLRRQLLDEAHRVGQQEGGAVRAGATRRVTGSRVAKSRSSASTSAPDSARMRVHLPALV